MMPLKLPVDAGEGLSVLCLGAHSDDIEIGCGASLLRLFGEVPVKEVHWVVFSSNEQREREARNSASRFLEKVPAGTVKVLGFRDGFLPSHRTEVKECFEEIRQVIDPDLIFTHFRHDLHQDHRLVNELTWNTFRNHFILEYEIPKYDGDLQSPNFFIPVAKETLDLKKEILLTCFESQLGKHWFDDTLLTSLMRIRGVEAASPTGFAEGFHARKVCI